MVYPWYETISFSDNVLQGDFVFDCPIIVPPETFDGEHDLQVKVLNTIIMSQSCDLENDKIAIVLVCPYYNLKDFLEKHPVSKNGGKGVSKVIDNLKKGNFPGYHILQKEENYNLIDYIVVDFLNVYGVDFGFLKNHLKDIEYRIRILPPYREHLSQAFARYFMRVGLPIDIDM
ncbi:MAG: hypothetical protein SGJ10_15030 [Bacteroidota bacterium]|nr:hypothetical protein [Bacteroidota bacterium]